MTEIHFQVHTNKRNDIIMLLLVPLIFLTWATTIHWSAADINVEDPSFGDHLLSNETALQGANSTGVPIGRSFLLLQLLKNKLKKLHSLDKVPTTSQPFQGCICVAFYLCGRNGTIISNGTIDIIDIRFRRCTGDYEICCYIRIVIPTTRPLPSSPIPSIAPTPRPVTYCYCVAIYQCIIVGGQVYGGSGINIINPSSPYLGTCTGGLVCCSYYPGVIPVPIPNLLPIPAVPALNFPGVILPIAPQVPPIVVPPPVLVPSEISPNVLPALPPIVYGQSCICVLVALCSLGFIPISNLDNLNPRLILGRQGQVPDRCGSGSMCCKLQKDSSVQQFAVAQAGVAKYSSNFVAPMNIKNPGTPDACVCILMGQCPDNQAVIYENVDTINQRLGPCMSSTLVCCRLQAHRKANVLLGLPNITSLDYTVSRTADICGIRDTTYTDSTPSAAGIAYFAEFPWMALLLIRTGSNDVFQCGGSLISSKVVLTAAHCVASCDPETLIIRLGELDIKNTNEPLPYQEVTTQSINIHPQYYVEALHNDVAIIVMSKAVSFAMHVKPVCLPSEGQVFAAGSICYATGWGRSAFNPSSSYQDVLHKVDLPIVSNVDCQNRLRQTRLGPLFQLHSSFICAGGEMNKDTCYKDGGGPLICQDSSTKQFVQAGIVSWGIGCGDNIPGVYVSVSQAWQWINQQLQIYEVAN